MHLTADRSSHTFGKAVARQTSEIVKDLCTPTPWIYWLDLITTFVVAQAGLFFYTQASLWSAPFFAGFVVASFASLRGGTFAHELNHVRAGSFRGLRCLWNVMFGIPGMFPLFMSEDHKIHHSNQFYGTAADAEYHPFARGPLLEIVLFLARIFIVPILVVGRFLFLAPPAWIFPPLRKWVWSLTSPNLALNVKYRRQVPTDPEVLLAWRIQEAACFAFGAVFAGLLIGGILPWTILLRLYCMLVFITGINYLRVLGGHRYLSDGTPSSHIDQFMDSYTITGLPILGELWAPLAMRYHALHHLLPSLPYHNIHKAHHRLMSQLPADSPYRTTVRATLWQAIREIVVAARSARPAGQIADVSRRLECLSEN